MPRLNTRCSQVAGALEKNGEEVGYMAANRESIFQPHSFTPSINNCDVAAFHLSKIHGAETVKPTVCVHLQPMFVTLCVNVFSC